MKMNVEKEVEGEWLRQGTAVPFTSWSLPAAIYNDTQVTAEGAKSMYHISRSMEADTEHNTSWRDTFQSKLSTLTKNKNKNKKIANSGVKMPLNWSCWWKVQNK